MNILLVRPKPKPVTIGLQSVMICEPLELMTLAAVLRAGGHNVRILDMILERRSFKYFINKYQPELVGITSYISHIGVIKEYVRQIKRKNANIKVCVGGVHAAVCPDDFSDPHIDLVCQTAEEFYRFTDCVDYISLMKKKIEGTITTDAPSDWKGSGRLDKEVLKKLQGASNTSFRYVTHPDYRCIEYDMRLNLFSFGRLKLNVNFTVIGLPVSVDCVGFDGDLKALLLDYKRRKGMFLVLNLPQKPYFEYANAQTLSTCVFENRFSSFESYLSALRSGYRRRIRTALKKGKELTIHKIENNDFSNELHSLYLEVLSKSKYPLETLNADFFRRFGGDIFTLHEDKDPVAFAALTQTGGCLNFIVGGMDYSRRDRLDLYFNLLLFVLRHGIESGVRTINFGQTSEHTKLRLGCCLEQRHMVALSGNHLIDWLLRRFCKLLGYKEPGTNYMVFHLNP